MTPPRTCAQPFIVFSQALFDSDRNCWNIVSTAEVACSGLTPGFRRTTIGESVQVP
jgi:hypothetical protein